MTVNPAAVATATANVSATYSVASQSVFLSASVTSAAGTVNEGTETFTILNGSTVIGTPVTVNVVSAAPRPPATPLPAGVAPTTITIQAVYNGTSNISGFSDTSHSLTVNPAPSATVSVSLDPSSNSGAPDHPGFTNITAPTFDVQVNQAGTITMDFNGNAALDQTLPVSSAGTYQFTAPTLANGAYVATANFSAGLSGTAQNTTSYTINTVPPQVTALTPTGTVNNRDSQVTVTFSEPVDLNTFTGSAIALTGPAGAIAVNQPQLVSGSTYSISFATQTVPGAYSLGLAASVADFAGNALGQSFIGSFTIALPDLAVTSTSAPSSASAGASIPIGWSVANVSPTNATGAAWNDAVYVSSKDVLDSTAIPLTSVAGPSSPLAPATSYSRSATVTLPSNVVPGNDFLLFVANDNGGQLESDAGNDTNDVVADPIVVSAPDLQVTSVSGPTTGFSGQSVLLTWTEKNIGTAPANGPWVDNVYTTTSAQGANPTLLGSFTFTGSLTVGASMQLTQPITLPQTTGTLWFAVTTNATQTVAEGSGFSNNTTVAASSISIAAVPLPDLVVTSITPPANGVFSGNTVPVSFVVKNQGFAPTSAPVWQDWVILSQDPNLAQTYQGQLNAAGPGGDQALNSQPVILGFNNPSYLGVGQSYQQNVNIPLPIGAQGAWYVYVVPDGTGAQHPFAMPEASRTDKLAISSAFSITLTPPPDLAVTAVQAPAQDFSGQPMTLNWTVSNIGTGSTVANTWTDAVYMSPDATLDSSATLLGTFAHQGALASGGTYTNSQQVNLPVGVSGSFYFLVKTDLNGQVFENGATANNVASTSTAETVNFTPPPDLEVSSISSPATALAGHGLTFSYTVKNGGAGATPNYTWNDALYLSPTATFQAGTAISLGQQNHQGSLAAGASYTNTVTTTLPNGLNGAYYLFVDTDSANAVFELSNAAKLSGPSGAIQVSQAPADLVVSTASAPATALPGSAILVNWTVANQSTGDTAVSSWQDSVYVDPGATLDGNAVLLGSFTHNGLLTGGGSYAQSQLLTLPIDLLGSYNLFVVANSSDSVHESNLSNNTSAPAPIAISLQVTEPQGGTQQAAVADLQVTSVTASAVAGGSVTVSWTVQNNGSGATNANYWDDDVWMSTNPTLGSGGTDVYLGTVQHTNPLPAGGGYSASGAFTVPPTLPAGHYYYIVATDRPVAPPSDPDNEGVQLVYESNATNNDTSTDVAAPVSPAPLPDLTVSNVTTPNSATSSGQLAVGWTVTNNGGATGNVPITDSVYLSYDQVFDPTDHYLGSVTSPGGLASGASYTQNAALTLPVGLAGTFYVFVVTNSNNAVAEQTTTNNSADDSQPVQIQLATPADLAAGTVTIPANGLAGRNISISYQVSNDGATPANGSWDDALYLSPTPTWNISDPLLGEAPQTQNLAPGGNYTGTLTAPLPGVAPGSYYVILRTNILGTFPEPALSNNQSASSTQMAIDAPPLMLGAAANGTLNQGQSAYYKVVVSAGQTLQVGLTSQTAAAYNELYVSFGTMPTRSQYDYRYNQPFQANQQITIPTTQAGAYYILAYGDDVPNAPESVSIAASIVPFSIQTVTPSQVGNGPVTLQISGAQFDFATTFQLRQGTGTVINATRTLVQDSATAFATFDLTGQPLGTYDVWASQSAGTSTELAAGLNVVAATVANSVQVSLIVPQAVLVGRAGTVTVNYANPGNTDLPAPLILLNGQNVLFRAPGQTDYSSPTLQLYGFNSTGPFGTLPPGFQGSITVSFKASTAGAGLASNFTLETLQDPSEPFDWNAFAAHDVPLNTSAQQWSSMVGQAQALLGSTWGDVVSFVGADSIQLLENTSNATDPNALNSLYNFDALLQYVVGVYGSTSPTSATPPYPVIASEGDVTVYNANIDASGNPVPLQSSYPTFVIIPGLTGFSDDYGNLAQAIAADTNSFPNGHVNVVLVAWQGATAGPTIDGVNVPWMAALHVDTDGAELGDLLTSLDQQGEIGISTTTVVAEGLGVDVGNQAARIAGGLENAIALNPASALSGYLPPSLTPYFQDSTAYETSSFLDTQLSLAAANQTLSTDDINNPILQHTFGVGWLTEQILAGNDSLLSASDAGGSDVLPPGNDPLPPSSPAGLVISSAAVVQIIPHDPNSIVGPKGSGTNGSVPTDQPLPYTVDFTNLGSAPAQEVVITEQLDPNLDWNTFDLGDFSFGGQTYSVPANTASYSTTIDLPDQPGYAVEVTANIDERTGVVTWTFLTIEITTGEIPLDPTIGVLPPESNGELDQGTSTGNGQGLGAGSVSYTIEAPSTAPTGTVIDAQAVVTFDTQPPLDTPAISNTVDPGTGLTSSVAVLPAFVKSSPFNVSWAGSDASNGSAISNYTIYVSDNGGPYAAWLKNTTLTSAPFVAQDGHSYRFYSMATDNVGNVQPAPTTAQASTGVDLTPPATAGFGFPAAGGSYNAIGWAGAITGQATDTFSGVQEENVSILDTATNEYWNGASFSSSTEIFLAATVAEPGATSSSWSLSFPSSNFAADGTYRVHALATDAAGNVETTGLSATFKYDTTPPVTTDVLSGLTGNSNWFRGAVTVTLSASDATSGVAATYYTVDGGSQKTYTGSPFAVSGDGTHHITFWSVDVAGNTEAVESATFRIDSVKPITTASLAGTQGSNGWYISTSVSVTLTASDATSGVAATYYSVDNGSQQTYTGSPFAVSGDGTHFITVWSVDGAGNTEAVASHAFEIDSVKPMTTVSLTGTQGSNGWYVSTAVSVTLTASDATSGVASTHYTVDGGSQQTYTGSPFTVSGDGTHHITFWSVDVAGNTEAAESDTFQIDSVKPITADSLAGTTGSNDWYTSTAVSVTLTASDPTSGVAATYYTVDGGSQQTYTGSPFTVSGDGTHHIAFWSVDVAGNAEAAESDSFKIDSVSPSTTDTLVGTQRNNGWFTSTSVSVTLNAADATSGVAATYYTVDGGSQQTYTGSPFAVSGDGTHLITFWSVDEAGNAEAADSDTVKIDSLSPNTTDSLAGTQGGSGWYTSASVNVTLTAVGGVSGVAATYYTVDGGSQQTYIGSPFTVSGDGTHVITFWSADTAGNIEAAESDSVKIDTVSPSTTDSPAGTRGSNGWYTSQSVSVTLTAKDATSGVASTYYTVDGGSQQTYASSPFIVSGDGTHVITFWSVDAAGNIEAAEFDSVKIDSVSPSTTDSPAVTRNSNCCYTSASVSVTLTPIDATSRVASTYYTVDGGSQQTYTGSSFSVSGEGTHQITFWSVDLAGNTETVETARLMIAGPADRLSITPPVYVVAAGKFTVTVHATDPFGNIDSTYNGSVALNLIPGAATGALSGSIIAAVQDGVATFSNLALSKAGTYTLLAASTGDLMASQVSPRTWRRAPVQGHAHSRHVEQYRHRPIV